MYKIVIFWHPEVQRGKRTLSLRFTAIEDSQRNMVKGGAWTKADDMACMKAFVIASEDTEKCVSQKRSDCMNTVFAVFRKFVMENHPDYSVPGVWASCYAQPLFQRYTRLKADCLRFEGEFRRVSGIQLIAEPREGFVRTATAGFRETKCLGFRAHSLPEARFALMLLVSPLRPCAI
jgi:hypothetical protein